MPRLLPASDPPDLAQLDEEERIEAVVEWFLENFEDALEGETEDEYGRPLRFWPDIDEYQELLEVFEDLTEDELDAISSKLFQHASEWSPAIHRIAADPEDSEHEEEEEEEDEEDEEEDGADENGDPDNDPNDSEGADGGPDANAVTPVALARRLDLLGGQLDRIEEAVKRLLTNGSCPEIVSIGIGHNLPPSSAAAYPTREELERVKESVAEVRLELAKPDAANDASIEVIQRAEGRFAWFKKVLIAFPTTVSLGVIAGAGKVVGDGWAMSNPEAVQAVVGALNTLGQWITHLLVAL